ALGDSVTPTAKSPEPRSTRRKAAKNAKKCSALQFFQHSATALADRRIHLVFAHVRGVIPAAFALGAVGFLHLHPHAAGAGPWRECDRRNDEQVAQFLGVPLEKGVGGLRR